MATAPLTRRDLEALLRQPHVIKAELAKWNRCARPSQRPPPGEWRIWCIQTGRGWGKTRTASQWVREQIEAGVAHVLAIGPTATDVHDVMAPMLLRVLPGATYLRSIEAPCITWEGSRIHLRSGARIDRCRGLEVGALWCDEIDYWRPELMSPREAWLAVVEPTLRVAPARAVVTSTPRRAGLLSELSKRSDVVVTRGHTRENADNLSAGFVDGLVQAYGGSWLERQELGGEIVSDIDGALVTTAMVEASRVSQAPGLTRIVVGVDPSGGTEEQGIVAVGRGHDGHLYVISDRSCRESPDGWGRRVIECFDRLEADRIVAERNFGGDMVESTLRTVRRDAPIRMVTASRGKHVRFEPVAALYEQGRLHHVGRFDRLEDEVTSFTRDGYEGSGSPNRADALVWAALELMPQEATWDDLYPQSISA